MSPFHSHFFKIKSPASQWSRGLIGEAGRTNTYYDSYEKTWFSFLRPSLFLPPRFFSLSHPNISMQYNLQWNVQRSLTGNITNSWEGKVEIHSLVLIELVDCDEEREFITFSMMNAHCKTTRNLVRLKKMLLHLMPDVNHQTCPSQQQLKWPAFHLLVWRCGKQGS